MRRAIIGTLLALGLIGAARADTQTALEAFARGEYDTAAAEFGKSAEAGDALAQFLLGAMYGSGQGVALDHAAAAGWYRKAAEGGHANAQFNLGTYYANGLGVDRDLKLALDWFSRAAVQGFSNAQFNLGHMFERGIGTRADRARAFAWWNLAAMSGHEMSRERLTALARKMSRPELERAGQLYGELLTKVSGTPSPDHVATKQ